jgi:hypothetical protein
LGNAERIADFNVPAMDHVDGLTVAEERDAGRGRRVLRKDAAEVRYRSLIATREHRCRFRGPQRMLQGHTDRGASLSGRASANRINHHHYRTVFRSQKTVDI